jgi:hypothetical protein
MKRTFCVVSLCLLTLLCVSGYAQRVSAVTLPAAVPTHVATDILSDPCDLPEAAESATCAARTSDNPLTGTNGTLYKISLIVSVVAGVVAVIVILLSGYRYITSGGDSQKAATAKNTLVGALVGLAVISLAQLIISTVVRSIS